MHVLTDTSELKNAATKTDKRIDVLEQMLGRVHRMKEKVSPSISQSVYQTIIQGPPENKKRHMKDITL